MKSKNKQEWFYTDIVKDHFLKPRNICKTEKEKEEFKKIANGYGEAGNQKCGDIMKFWIKVDPKTNRIKDCRWETWGCLLGSTKITTPTGRVKIKDLKYGDYVWGWNGKKVVKVGVLNVKKREVERSDILKISFNRKEGSKHKHYNMYVSKKHLFYLGGEWVPASDLKKGNELFHLNEHEWRFLNNPGRYEWVRDLNSKRLKINNPMFNPETVNFLRNGEKIHEIREITQHEFDQIKNKKGMVDVYDLQLQKPHTYFSGKVLSHNCASAIASTSMLSIMITENKGMKIEDALKIKPEDIAKHLGGLPSIKFHCSILGDQALRNAIENYKNKVNNNLTE